MITENEIDAKLQQLQGKVPSVLIKDLRDKLVSKMDILTPEQVDVIIKKVLENYSSQVERLKRLDKRIEEIGKYLEEIRERLSESRSPLERQNTGIAESSISWEPQRIEFERVEPPKKGREFEEEGEREFSMTEEIQIPKEIRDVLITPTKSRARLEKLPDDALSTMIALKWLGFLIERAGMQNLENVLEFYYTIGWISEEVLETLLKYANGTRPHQREPNWKPDDKLTIQDHLISLLFIERLRGTRITPEVLNSIERELKMMTKILEHVYGV
ncbi:FlaD/FlaE family flagellar protein [Thermococcus sp. 2319x1]|uniref:FlaD/FlaE family flagellar protein n=1 Tax=Thermococcus sp. 2319x1 TaxID=1674923 RepID=UPI001582DDFD|nr:FlaD/FlaE family flagellar protein [Thermococcus sp. 2319x1]